ncbi:MAG: YolD-like family protein [Bacteroidales bacterium]|nr:YolD-like family protein [Bacteroidales bacterium]
MLSELDGKLSWIRERLGLSPAVEITFFASDKRKSGGAYRTHSGIVKRIDGYAHTVDFADGASIPLRDILDIRLL